MSDEECAHLIIATIVGVLSVTPDGQWRLIMVSMPVSVS